MNKKVQSTFSEILKGWSQVAIKNGIDFQT